MAIELERDELRRQLSALREAQSGELSLLEEDGSWGSNWEGWEGTHRTLREGKEILTALAKDLKGPLTAVANKLIYYSCDVEIVVVSGFCLIYANGKRFDLRPGSKIHIPAGTTYRISVPLKSDLVTTWDLSTVGQVNVTQVDLRNYENLFNNERLA